MVNLVCDLVSGNQVKYWRSALLLGWKLSSVRKWLKKWS